MIDKLPKGFLNAYTLTVLINLLCLFSLTAEAKRPEFHLALKNHLFYPAKITIPRNKKVKLVILNHDHSVEEFDSFDLNREKVLFPKQEAIIFIGPLPEGEYQFFGEYHPNSARGKVVVVDTQIPKKELDDETPLKEGEQHVN